MRKKILIIGGGFAGLTFAKKIDDKKFEVVLIDKTNHHLFQPLLYQVATAALSPGDISAPLREVLRNKNIEIIMGEVEKILPFEKKIIMDGEELTYDFLVLAVGARHSYFGNNYWEFLAPGLKTLSDALEIREKILYSFELAEKLYGKTDIKSYLNFVIIGGGPTGVEMAGAIAEIARFSLLKDFKKIDTKETKVFLIEAQSRILPGYDPKLSLKAQEDLEHLGVKVLTNSFVANITEEGVYIKGNLFIPAKTIIWAAGNQASQLISDLPCKKDKLGRAIVEKDLSIKEFPEIFVIGDAAAFKNDQGNYLPAIAPVAIQQGKYLAEIFNQEIPLEIRKPFKYFHRGNMATIGKARAVAEIKRLKLSGFIAWLAWTFVHILFLIKFRNKLKVLIEWFIYYITNRHSVRIITKRFKENFPAIKEKAL